MKKQTQYINTRQQRCGQPFCEVRFYVERCNGVAFIYSSMRTHSGVFCSISLTPMFSRCFLCSALLIFAFPVLLRLWRATIFNQDTSHAPPHIQTAIAKCMSLEQKPRPPLDFWKRSRSDRYEAGTRPVLIKHGRIWTGRNNGTQVVYGDILMEKGIIKSVGNLDWLDLTGYGSDLQVVDADGAWITPGLVDAHSHIGDFSLPILEGSNDGDSLNGIAQPWLRSLDGLNTHDETYPLTLAGGVTTALVLPGSAVAIGRQIDFIVLIYFPNLCRCRWSGLCDQAKGNVRKIIFLYVGRTSISHQQYISRS